MEAPALRRTLLHIVAAVILGLTLMLMPATIIAKEKPQNSYLQSAGPLEAITPQILDRYSAASGPVDFRYPAVDFAVLAVCFALALAAYLLVKRRAPRPGVRWMPPY